MDATANLKDFWGNDALDYGSINEMTDKYADKIFVFVTDRPFGRLNRGTLPHTPQTLKSLIKL